MNYQIFPLGDNALTVQFGSAISIALNERVSKLARFLNRSSLSDLIEIFPAYASLTCFYDILSVRQRFPEYPTAFDAIKNFTQNALLNLEEFPAAEPSLLKIPICFAEKYALDLSAVAAANNLPTKRVIKIFLARTYRVFMLGFLPGFAYLGEVDPRICAARKPTPRLKVPKGSVGIAGAQTGIYSLESPGGWQIIGKTNVELFTPDAKTPTLLQAGDSVKFYESEI